MVVEVVLNLLRELMWRQVIVLQDLDKVLHLDVFILLERLLGEVNELLLPLAFFLVLLQQRTSLFLIQKLKQLFDLLLVV